MVLVSDTERFSELGVRDSSATIFIKHFECCRQLPLRSQLTLTHGCHAELCVVDSSIAVYVYSFKYLIDLFSRKLYTKVFLVTRDQLIFIKTAITVFVHQFENFL